MTIVPFLFESLLIKSFWQRMMKRKSNFHSDLLNFDSIDLISFLLNKFLFNAFPVVQNNKIRWFFQAG